ncbi:hypothetical protein DPMN_120396 [Dreissena polymorpha]|uniref:Uncharacterized protein n=1 Tax=Dreissena polymorpha TaxID=45954 RepID=A0A9D4JQ41_DREPO|nr:hypothetical protein DPMN_120396 [Dreissena polymorpha]
MAEDVTVLFGSHEECVKSLRDNEIQTNTRYAVTSGCELDFVCSPCSKKEQTHRSEADIDVDDFAANWEMGFDISDIHDNVTDEDLDSTRAEGNGNVDDDGAIDGDHITGNEMDDTTGNGDDDGDIDGPPDME